MLRWLTRLALGALIIALLFWLWTRYNADLEEEELEEEIPLEFEVSADADLAPLPVPDMAEMGEVGSAPGVSAAEVAASSMAASAPENLSANGASDATDGQEDAPERALDDDASEVVPPTLSPRPKGEQEGFSATEQDDSLHAPPPGA